MLGAFFRFVVVDEQLHFCFSWFILWKSLQSWPCCLDERAQIPNPDRSLFTAKCSCCGCTVWTVIVCDTTFCYCSVVFFFYTILINIYSYFVYRQQKKWLYLSCLYCAFIFTTMYIFPVHITVIILGVDDSRSVDYVPGIFTHYTYYCLYSVCLILFSISSATVWLWNGIISTSLLLHGMVCELTQVLCSDFISMII